MSAIDEVLPETGVNDEDAQRLPAGEQPRDLTITLLADYGIRNRVSWPSAGIVALLAEFGISAPAARATLSRLARRGVLQVSKQGRRTAYRLTDEAATSLKLGGRRIARFTADAEAWDGRWTLVAFAGAGEGSAPRRLRARLRWLGFAPMYDGLWVSPSADPEFTVHSLAAVRPAALTVFRGRDAEVPIATRRPLDAWDLDMVAERYHGFLRDWTGPAEDAGQVPDGRSALLARTRMMDAYRSFPALDPQVPRSMMPGGWPRTAAGALFERRYDAWGEPAEARVREVLTGHGVAVPDGLGHHKVADLRAAMT